MITKGLRPHEAPLLQQMRGFALEYPPMRRVTRTLERVYDAELAKDMSAGLVERALMKILEVNDGRLVTGVARLDEALARLSADLDRLSVPGQAAEASRSLPERIADMQTLRQELAGLRTFEQVAREVLDDGEHDLRGMLRNEMEAQLGTARSYAPMGEAAAYLPGGRPAAGAPRPAGPPQLRAGTPPATAKAVAELHTALIEAPPPPAPPRPGERFTAAELAGTQSTRVRRAARRLVALHGGERGGGIPEAVRLLLAGADRLDERNQLVIELLIAHDRLAPNARVPGTGPHVQAGGWQETQTGSTFEWTATLQEKVGHYEGKTSTVGIDNIVRGWVRDAKHGNVPAGQSGGVRGPVAAPKDERFPGDVGQRHLPLRHRPWEAESTKDLIAAMRTSEPETLREQIIVLEERIGIEVTAQMDHQLRFARENGLRGVEWVVNDPELAAVYERIWIEQVRPGLPDVPAKFTAVGH